MLKQKLLWEILSVQTGSTIRIAGDAKLAAIISPQSIVKEGIYNIHRTEMWHLLDHFRQVGARISGSILSQFLINLKNKASGRTFSL